MKHSQVTNVTHNDRTVLSKSDVSERKSVFSEVDNKSNGELKNIFLDVSTVKEHEPHQRVRKSIFEKI